MAEGTIVGNKDGTNVGNLVGSAVEITLGI
jgi:hypothetical protein